MDKLNIVTGATGYTGKYVTRRLLAMGQRVKSLTNHPYRKNPFGDTVPKLPYNFENPEALTESMLGATTLYNTYWVRFSHKEITFDSAVKNTRILIEAAKRAGIKRIVHASIANPDPNSNLPYYRGKGLLEQAIIESGLSYAIIRPTVIFGPEDILINNIAWLLRKFLLFAIVGSGEYKIQPIFIEDMTELMIKAGKQTENIIWDAVGPEIFTFNELVELIRRRIHSRSSIIHISPKIMLPLSRLIGCMVQDVVLTKEEIDGLLANLLVSSQPPTGRTRFTEWLKQNASILGTGYASELRRHYR